MGLIRLLVSGLLLSAVGCANTTTLPLTNDIVEVSTAAAPICGGNGARKVAIQQAAVETIKRGYDRFIVLGKQSENNIGVVGYTPQQSYSTGSAYGNVFGNNVSVYGNSTTTTYGGQPIIGGSHDQALTIQMFHEGNPAGARAISARELLGPDWAKIVESGGPRTCG